MHVVNPAIEAQTFTINDPSFFYSMYSPPRSEGQYRSAKDRVLEDMRFTSKMVRLLFQTRNIAHLNSSLPEDSKCLHHVKRISVHSILHARESFAFGTAQTTLHNATAASCR
jgi:hypothetical protein